MKTVLVTGATDGIGYATAESLLAAGHQVVVHGRHAARAEEACTKLGRGKAATRVTPVWGDFAALDEVVALAAQVAAAAPRLDVLINNAGTWQKQRRESADGFELTLAVNHYAPLVLTLQLAALLEAQPGSRIVNVSSMTHADGTIDLADMDMHQGYSAYAAYARSKLCNLLFTQTLAARLTGTTVNALHPGVIATKLLRAGFGMGGGSLAAGARTSVHLALDAGLAGISGGYFVDCAKRQPAASARDAALAEALWQHSLARMAAFVPAAFLPH